MLSNIKLLSPAVLEDKAMADYNAHLGESVVVHNVIVKTALGRHDYCALSTPAVVKVLPTARESLLYFSCKDLLTPSWSVQLLESHPEIPKNAVLRVHGRSYQADGQVHPGDVFARANDVERRGTVAVTVAVARAALRFGTLLVGGQLRHQ